MKINQIEEKIQFLEKWLTENPNNPERYLIESDIKKLRTLLEKKS